MYIGDKSETLLGINGTKARIFRDGKQTAVETLWATHFGRVTLTALSMGSTAKPGNSEGLS